MTKNIINALERLIYLPVKGLIKLWDPDYTKLTPSERASLAAAEKDIAENGTISHNDINWY